MAHKRTRAQTSSSKPQPETPTSPRKNKKLIGSAASNKSQLSGGRKEESSSIKSPLKRQKRGSTAVKLADSFDDDDQDELSLEFDSNRLREHAAPPHDRPHDLADHRNAPSVDLQRHHVQFGSSSPIAVARAQPTAPPVQGAANHSTAHPRKMGVKRRVTSSPSGGYNGVRKKVKVNSGRTSLPSTLSEKNEDSVYVRTTRQFAPLRQVLRDRVSLRREHAAREARISELERELHSSTANQERVGQVEQELHALRYERDSSPLNAEIDPASIADDEMLVFDGQDSGINPLSSPSGDVTAKLDVDHYASVTTKSGEPLDLDYRSQHAAWDAERRKFEDSVVILSQEANEARTKLQILEIELGALGFEQPGTSSEGVLMSIRESFDHAREGLQSVLQNLPAGDLSNENVLAILINTVKNFAHDLQNRDAEIAEYGRLETDLGDQIHGLLDHLADAEIRKQTLERRLQHLDETNDAKARDIEQLHQDLLATQNAHSTSRAELAAKTTEAEETHMENLVLAKNIQRLTMSLQSYRDEEARLTELITRMEDEHKTGVAKMNREREKTVRALEDRFDEQVRLRGEVEQIWESRQAVITGLELRIEVLGNEKDDLNRELNDVRNQRDTERHARESVEADLAAKAGEIEDLEARMGGLDEQTEGLLSRIEQLRQATDAERAQREAVEAELAGLNKDFGRVCGLLREQGTQANELRQKLFEAQQTNDQNVKDLEHAAAQRDEQFQSDMASEVARREAAEQDARRQSAAVADLERRLAEVEQQMQQTLAGRADRVKALVEERNAKTHEVEKLQMDGRRAAAAHDDAAARHNQAMAELTTRVDALELTLREHLATIGRLKAETASRTAAHDADLADRDAQVAALHHTLATARQDAAALREQRESLERRVEAEATAMLQVQAARDAQVDALHAAIRDKQAKILVVEDKARGADERWQDVLAARDTEIAHLNAAWAAQAADVDAIKHKFAEYVERASARVTALHAALAAVQDLAGYDPGTFDAQGDGERVLKEIEAMTSSLEPGRAGAATSPGRKMQKLRGGRKKRVVDSGIGLDDTQMEEGL